MQLRVKGRNFDVTDNLRQYAEDKATRTLKHFADLVMDVEIELSVERNRRIPERQQAEITVTTRGPLVRAKEDGKDMFAAINQACEKLERQMVKYKEKTYHSTAGRKAAAAVGPVETPVEEEPPEPVIVKVKQFPVKPMDPEEAAVEMELLGHDFFVFTNSETQEINVLYRRQDGNYGLIEPRPRS